MFEILCSHLQYLRSDERSSREHTAVVAAEYTIAAFDDAIRAEKSHAISALFLQWRSFVYFDSVFALQKTVSDGNKRTNMLPKCFFFIIIKTPSTWYEWEKIKINNYRDFSMSFVLFFRWINRTICSCTHFAFEEGKLDGTSLTSHVVEYIVRYETVNVQHEFVG